MSDRSLWRLCTEFSIRDAVLLIIGRDPGDFDGIGLENLRSMMVEFRTVLTALCNAVELGSVATARACSHGEYGPLDVEGTLISVAELDRFTKAGGLPCPIFDRTSVPPRIAPDRRMRSKKLDAANRVWEALTSNPALLKGTSPKGGAKKWLTEHAAELELLNRDGEPNSTAIEEIAKVVNWKPEGGAPATPGAEPFAAEEFLRSARPSDTGPREAFAADMDDEEYPFGAGEPTGAKLKDEIPF